MSPFEALRLALEAAVVSELRSQTEAIDRLRRALDAYETSIRAKEELSIVQAAAALLEVSALPLEPIDVPRDELASALAAFAALLTPSPAIALELQPESRSRERTEAALEVESPSRERESTTQLRDARVLAKLIERAGAPPRLAGDVELIDELEKLDMVTSSSEMAAWRALTREEQQVWLSYLVARARGLRERAVWSASIGQRLRTVIVRFPTFARDTRPGHVNGMRPEHVPVRDSWYADASALYTEIRHLVDVDEECEARGATAPSRRSRPTTPG